MPYKILYDCKVLGRQAHVNEQKLTIFQEVYLGKYAKQLDNVGIPACHNLLQAQAQRILRQNGDLNAILGTT